MKTKRGAERKFNFAKKAIDALPIPEPGQRDYYRDAKTRGLVLVVTPAGTKTFMLYRKIQGRPRRITLRLDPKGPPARFPEVSVEQARRRAEELNAEINQGRNPADERRASQGEWTLGDLWDTWLREYAERVKKSWEFDRGRWKNHLEHWKNRRLSSITKADVQRLHEKIGKETGPRAANMVVSLLRAMFVRARDQWGYTGPNPADRINRFRERSRERFLSAEELPRFFESLNKEPNETARDFFYLCLLTGARRRNTDGMRWADLDLTQGVWRVPGEVMKTGEDCVIPLVPMAIEILSDRKEKIGNKSPWVFPANSRSGHLEEPKSAWKCILERAGITDLTVHDLRRNLGSWATATGASLQVIGKALGHKSQAATVVYSRPNLDPVRAAMETATGAMMAAGRKDDEEQAQEQETAERQEAAQDDGVIDLAQERQSAGRG